MTRRERKYSEKTDRDGKYNSESHKPLRQRYLEREWGQKEGKGGEGGGGVIKENQDVSSVIPTGLLHNPL